MRHPDTVSKDFKSIVRKAGVGTARLHDLRHSAATYMLASGMPIQVVKEILGHASLTTTMIYVDVMDDMKKKEILKLRFK